MNMVKIVYRTVIHGLNTTRYFYFSVKFMTMMLIDQFFQFIHQI